MPETNVFVVPADRSNFDRTVASPISTADAEDSDAVPDAIADAESIRVWGVPEGKRNRSTYERMEPGDLLLFYVDGAYAGVGRVGEPFADEAGWLAETHWEDGPTEGCFTVDEFAAIQVPRSTVNTVLFDYGPDYSPSGAMRVAEDRVNHSVAAIDAALRRYGSA